MLLVTQFGSSGDDLQACIDEFDLMIANQDVIQIYMCVCDVVVVVIAVLVVGYLIS